MVVLTNGQVVPCCRDYLYEFNLGNVNEAPLEAIWNGKEYQRMRELHAAGQWDRLSLCGRCETWMTRTPERRKQWISPGVVVERGPFFRTATAGRAPAYEVVPFEAYHFPPSTGKNAPPPSRDSISRTEFIPFERNKFRSTNRLKVLMLCYVYPFDANTIHDHCESFRKYSRHDYYYFNPVGKDKPQWLRLDDFDAVMIHYSISTISGFYLRPSWIDALRAAKAHKIMFIQDEYRKVDEHVARMQLFGVDALFTCVPFAEVPKVYGQEKLPDTSIFCTLTGYVPEYLEKLQPDFDAPRPIDVGYRSRTLGFWYGELGQEKARIASEFVRHAAGSGLACDISAREEDRIYGKAWVRFLQSCRCTLGTESGASVFDFSGEIETRVKDYLAAHPGAAYEETRELFFKNEDGKIRLNQISPRVFEAAACGSCLVMFEGEYSGLVKPDEHFIPLKKDFSNFEEVLAKIQDRRYIAAMARRAHQHLIVNREYSYQRFAEGFDRALDRFRASRAAACQASSSGDLASRGTEFIPSERTEVRSTNGANGKPAMAGGQASGSNGRAAGAARHDAAGIAAPFPSAPAADGWSRRLSRSMLVGHRVCVYGARFARRVLKDKVLQGGRLAGRVRASCAARSRALYYRAKGWSIRMLTDWQGLYRRDRLRLFLLAVRSRINRPPEYAPAGGYPESPPLPPGEGRGEGKGTAESAWIDRRTPLSPALSRRERGTGCRLSGQPLQPPPQDCRDGRRPQGRQVETECRAQVRRTRGVARFHYHADGGR